MNSKISPAISRLTIRYGFVGGVFLMVVFLTFYFIGIKPGAFVTMIANLIVLSVFLFISLKDFKDNYNHGQFRFYHGMTIGVLSLIIMGVTFCILYGLYISIFNPEYLGEKMDYLVNDLQNKITIEQDEDRINVLNRQLSGLQNTTIIADVLSEAIKRIAFGYLLVPIFSIVFRTRHKA